MHILNINNQYQLYVVYYVENTHFEHNFAHVVAIDRDDAVKKFFELNDFADFNVERVEGAYPVTGKYVQENGVFSVAVTQIKET